MDSVLSTADKLLSLLPFNGDKTTLGLAVKALLPIAVAHFPVLITVAPIVSTIADIAVALGLTHKVVKVAK